MYLMPLPKLFVRAFELVQQEPVILMPGVAAGVLNAVIYPLFFGPQMVVLGTGVFPGVMSFVSHSITYGILAQALMLFAISATTKMAGRLWKQGAADIDDAIHLFREFNNGLYLTLLQLIAFFALAGLFIIPTCGVSLCAYFFFSLYAISSAVIGRYPGFDALRASASIAQLHVQRTMAILAYAFVLLLIFAILAQILKIIPLLGSLLVGIETQVVLSYLTVIIVGEYIQLHDLQSKETL